ncbi:MAG: hydrogenase maturation nickel metallochaperone HypA [Candidatus Omnitrophota bacterium]
MHETGVVDNIIFIVNSKLKEIGPYSRVLRINILLGELEQISADHFEFHFKERAVGTSLEKAILKFKKVKPGFRCKNCGNEFLAGKFVKGCPECKSAAVEVIGGAGISVESIEVD